jgi:hypothetical protein
MKDMRRIGIVFPILVMCCAGCTTKEVLTSDQRTEWEHTVARESNRKAQAQPLWKVSSSGIVSVVEAPNPDRDSDAPEDE